MNPDHRLAMVRVPAPEIFEFEAARRAGVNDQPQNLCQMIPHLMEKKAARSHYHEEWREFRMSSSASMCPVWYWIPCFEELTSFLLLE
jgi:hypothetical protein